MSNIIPFGYAVPNSREKLDRIMVNSNAFLVDIRMRPYASSLYIEFNGPALAARFPGRYLHVPELGNVNYKQKGNIKIANLEKGLARLERGLKKGYQLVLLCGCRDYAKCHRRVVVEMLIQQIPVKIVHL